MVLFGTSSTLHEDNSYLVKEMLVYNTDKFDKRYVKEGFIPLDKFSDLKFLNRDQKKYIRDRENAVFYKSDY